MQRLGSSYNPQHSGRRAMAGHAVQVMGTPRAKCGKNAKHHQTTTEACSLYDIVAGDPNPPLTPASNETHIQATGQHSGTGLHVHQTPQCRHAAWPTTTQQCVNMCHQCANRGRGPTQGPSAPLSAKRVHNTATQGRTRLEACAAQIGSHARRPNERHGGKCSDQTTAYRHSTSPTSCVCQAKGTLQHNHTTA